MNQRLGFTIFLALLASALGACSSDDEPNQRAHSQEESRATPTAAEEDEHGHAAREDGHAHDEAKNTGEHEDQHGDDHGDEHGDEHGHEEEQPNFARIDPKAASQHGIEVATATSGTVAESIALTGRLIIDPRRVALVRARFAGPVRSIAKDVGDSVSKGEVLAQIESNESLTVYELRSPIAGVVLERMSNVGDVADSEPLFRIGDLTNLQTELRVFSKEQGRIEKGAGAIVRIGDEDVPGKVVSLIPEIDSRTQAVLVRVALSPRGAISAVPGQFVTGRIEVGRGDAVLAVPLEAVQRFEGDEVIFVPEEEGFRARAVTTGRRDSERVEITEGLKPGEPYVAAGAFLVKADIGKRTAEHDH